jgi:hypothetical protein
MNDRMGDAWVFKSKERCLLSNATGPDRSDRSKINLTAHS